MAYLHIRNLYQEQEILLFRQCHALEKVHGTSAHVALRVDQPVHFFAGGESHPRFVALFDAEVLAARHLELFTDPVTIYGEAYGGKCMGMRKTYGADLRFIAFEVQVGDCWLSVPNAADVAEKFGLEFVPWRLIEATLAAIDAERDRPSEIAERRGCGEQVREGIVLRPPIEVVMNNGRRVIAKHKRPEFAERQTVPNVDPTRREVMDRADEIANEWVIPMRLTHVLDKLPGEHTIQRTPEVIAAMVEDVMREAEGEIVDSPVVRKAIGRRAVALFKRYLHDQIAAGSND